MPSVASSVAAASSGAPSPSQRMSSCGSAAIRACIEARSLSSFSVLSRARRSARRARFVERRKMPPANVANSMLPATMPAIRRDRASKLNWVNTSSGAALAARGNSTAVSAMMHIPNVSEPLSRTPRSIALAPSPYLVCTRHTLRSKHLVKGVHGPCLNMTNH